MNVIKSDNSLDVEPPAEKEKKIEWRNRRVDLIETESGNYEIIVYKTRMRVSITGAIPISTQKPSFVIKLNNSSQINQESPSCFSIITDNKHYKFRSNKEENDSKSWYEQINSTIDVVKNNVNNSNYKNDCI